MKRQKFVSNKSKPFLQAQNEKFILKSSFMNHKHLFTIKLLVLLLLSHLVNQRKNKASVHVVTFTGTSSTHCSIFIKNIYL